MGGYVSDLTERVDAIFRAYDRADSPGCALGVWCDGELAYARGYGMADLDHNVPIGPETVFHVASVSKQFTASLVALLAAEGQLSLDDDVRTYLPELPAYGPTITLRHLIHHTSGLRDQWDLLTLAGWREHDVVTNADVLAIATRQRALNFAPGDAHLYSNTGYTFLGLIVERVTGQSLRSYAERRLFRPLEMEHSHFHDDHTRIVKNRASAYEPREGDGYRISVPAFDTVGATSLFTTALDLARWIDGFWERGQIDPAVVQQMLTPGRLNDGEVLTYALGVVVRAYRGAPIVEHSGGDAGYRSHLIWFPEQHFAVTVLGNLSTLHPDALARRVADVYLEDHLAPIASSTAIAVPEADLVRWVGLYHDPGTGNLLRLAVEDGTLVNQLGERFALEPRGAGRFRMAHSSAEVELALDAEGTAEPRQLADGPRVGTYRRVPEAHPSPSRLADCVGTYHSDEVAADYAIALRGETLIWRRAKFDDTPLVPTFADAFCTDDATRLAFDRGASGWVHRLRVSTFRVRNVAFTRVSG